MFKTILNFFQRIPFLRLRRGLCVLHLLSRGYVIRMHVIKMINAVRNLQSMARQFLNRTREYWDKVKDVVFNSLSFLTFFFLLFLQVDFNQLVVLL